MLPLLAHEVIVTGRFNDLRSYVGS